MFNSGLKREKEGLIKEIELLKNNCADLSNKKALYETQVNNLNSNIRNLEKSVNESNNTIKELDEMIKKREKFIVDSELKYIENSLTGIEFEQYASDLLTKNGYICSVTKASGDGGVDIIANKDGYKYAIQCKLYSSTVGNKAIQEVYTAKGLNQCDFAIVLTNNVFTKQAIEEGKALNVQLWDRDKLKELLYEGFNFDIKHIDQETNYQEKKNKDKEENGMDSFLVAAIETCMEVGQASTSFIQRRFKVDYARAGRILDQMEAMGIISGYEGSKPRTIIITPDKWASLKHSKKL